MEMETCAANRQGSEDEGEGERRSVGDWWMEGRMGVIDVGETAVVHRVYHGVELRRGYLAGYPRLA